MLEKRITDAINKAFQEKFKRNGSDYDLNDTLNIVIDLDLCCGDADLFDLIDLVNSIDLTELDTDLEIIWWEFDHDQLFVSGVLEKSSLDLTDEVFNSYIDWRNTTVELLEEYQGSIDCGLNSVREDFSNWLNLDFIIEFQDMIKLERRFENQ